MWILPLVGYIGTLLGFCFLTLAIASGLYYLSELVEEHSVIAKRFLTRLIYSVIGIQTVLWLVDGLPFWATVLTIVSHVVYLGNMRRFPFVKLSDPLFLASCGMLPLAGGRFESLLTRCSSRFGQSLCLVPSFLRYAVARVPTYLVLRQGRCS